MGEGILNMSTDEQPVDEQPPTDDTDEQRDPRVEHRQAQSSGDVFEGRPHGDR